VTTSARNIRPETRGTNQTGKADRLDAEIGQKDKSERLPVQTQIGRIFDDVDLELQAHPKWLSLIVCSKDLQKAEPSTALSFLPSPAKLDRREVM
jgi:hypothetical protein